MGMPVDEARNQAPPADIRDRCMRGGNCLQILADSEDPPSADGQMANTCFFRRKNAGIGKYLEQGFVREQKRGDILH